jgi:nitrogen regulatory protein PII
VSSTPAPAPAPTDTALEEGTPIGAEQPERAGTRGTGQPAKLIHCILPDDGSERRLLTWLREQGITRANSVYCRGHSVLREAVTRRGKLPEPSLVRMVQIVVEAAEADNLFDRIYEQADIDRPGGGAMFMTPLLFATSFAMPTGIYGEPGDL